MERLSYDPVSESSLSQKHSMPSRSPLPELYHLRFCQIQRFVERRSSPAPSFCVLHSHGCVLVTLISFELEETVSSLDNWPHTSPRTYLVAGISCQVDLKTLMSLLNHWTPSVEFLLRLLKEIMVLKRTDLRDSIVKLYGAMPKWWPT